MIQTSTNNVESLKCVPLKISCDESVQVQHLLETQGKLIACTRMPQLTRSNMASHFDFYSFLVYEFLISTIQFLLVKMLTLDIRNLISTSNNGYFDISHLMSTITMLILDISHSFFTR